MKALEKDRRRRYATAHGLALDVQHYLASEPISARPPSAIYKLQKMAVRNKALFIGIGVVTLLLVVSLAVVSAALAKERQARNVADAALRQAESDKANAPKRLCQESTVTKFLEDMLRGGRPVSPLAAATLRCCGKFWIKRPNALAGRWPTNPPSKPSCAV